MKNRVGLVFSGGGGKGSYQIGVLKALKEFGWDANISAVSGTSVGALNAALFLQNDLRRAEEIWLSISPNKILSFQAQDLMNHLILSGLVKSVPPLFLLWAKRLAQQGVFSREGMLEILMTQVHLSRLQESKIPVYATCFDLYSFGVEYFRLNGLEEEKITSILLASSAIPILYGTVEIYGREYLDGGLLDNVPILPLYRLGCDLLIVIYLHRPQEIPRESYPNTTILPIVPQEDQGGIFTGTLDFHPQSAERRISQGYKEACQVLSPYHDLLRAEERKRILVNEIAREEREMREMREDRVECQLHKKREEMRESIHHFNRLMMETSPDHVLDHKEPEERSIILSSSHLLPDSEREVVETRILDLLEKNREESQMLLDTALDALGYLAPLKGSTDALDQKSLFKRFLHSITGRTLQLSALNQRDLALAQYAALSLMNQIHEQGFMTLEYLATLKSKTSRLFSRLVHTEDRVYSLTLEVYSSLSQLFLRIQREMLKDREKIESLSQHTALSDWLTKVKVQTYKGVSYYRLSSSKGFVCIVNDFFRLTNGHWNSRELLSLKQAFLDVELKEEVDPYLFLDRVLENEGLKNRLLKGLSIGSIEPLRDSIEKEREERQIQEPASIPLKVPLYHLALEVLYSLSHGGAIIQEPEENRVRVEYIEALKTIEEMMKRYALHVEEDRVHALLSKVEEYMPFLLVIQSDSSNRSILAQYLNIELIGDSAIVGQRPIEYHPSTHGVERLLLYFYDGMVREYPLSSLPYIHGPIEEIRHLRVDLNGYGFKRDSIILGELPDLRYWKIQEESMDYYLEEGSFFLICTDGKGLKEIYAHLGGSFFHTREYALVWLDHKDCLHRETYPAQYIEEKAFSVASLSKNGEGVRLILSQVREAVNRAIRRRFYREILSLRENLYQALYTLKEAESISLHSLKEREEKIQREKGELKKLLQEEEVRVREELTSIRGEVMQEIERSLYTKMDLLLRRLKDRTSGDRIQEIIENAANEAIREYSFPIFQASAQRLSDHLSLGIRGVFQKEVELALMEDLPQIEEKVHLLSKSALGLLLLNPVALLFQGLLHFFSSPRREREREEELYAWIKKIMGVIQERGEEHLSRLGQEFLLLLYEQVEEELGRIDELLSLLREEIGASKKERRDRKRQIEEHLLVLQEML